jgi:hypothetical protein
MLLRDAGAFAATCTTWQESSIVPGMITRDASEIVPRWKLIALVSAFVAVAAVASLIGWVARGASGAGPSSAGSFTGGGWTVSNSCFAKGFGTNLGIGTKVKIFTADGVQLAAGKIIAEQQEMKHGCRQEFAVGDIPSGRGVYLVTVRVWTHVVSEAKLRGNMAEIMLG